MTADLARATIASVSVLGALHASPAVKAALADRDEMKTMLNLDTIREATRLTYAGQLAEATAFLQRMLRGERAPDPISPTPGRVSLRGREPPTMDAKANGRRGDR